MSGLTLESVCNDFQTWRTTRGKVGKIPNYLWDKALALLEHYQVGEVTKALRLSGGQVSAKLREHKEPKTLVNKVNFIEAPMSPLMNDTTNAHFCASVELKRVDGARITINNLPEQTLLLVLNKFMQVY